MAKVDVWQGRYVNPGAAGYAGTLLLPQYVDKTALIGVVTRKMEKNQGRILISRPRRFGKTLDAGMLCAFFQQGLDTENMFADKKIALSKGWKKHLNQYHVIYVDMNTFQGDAEELQRRENRKALFAGRGSVTLRWIDLLEDLVTKDIRQGFGDDVAGESFTETLTGLVRKTGKKIIWICDEWDLIFREDIPDPFAFDDYITFLKRLFKGTDYQNIFAAAYMTGIMPMLKVKGQSAVSEFDNYTMLSQGPFAPFTGFTETEVAHLCRTFHGDFPQMKNWYDGYSLYDEQQERIEIYNPLAVSKALEGGSYHSYWVETSSYELLRDQIDQDINGLHDAIMKMAAGEAVSISNTTRFTNRIKPYDTVDDELTLLVHLGYLSYDEQSKTARIPNEEIRFEFISNMQVSRHADVMQMIRLSDQVLTATLEQEEQAVADAIEKIHLRITDPKHYNHERDLAGVMRFAYLTARDDYIQIYELPGGKGYADIVLLPKAGRQVPLLVVELKWDKPVSAAIDQIKRKRYPEILKEYGGNVLLVVITYSAGTKKHTCRIEKLSR